MTKEEKQSLLNELSSIEKLELEAILDRISVQNPEGESFKNWLYSLRNKLFENQRFVAVLLDTLSRFPTKSGEKVFLALNDCVNDSKLRKIIKKAKYRFEQHGFLKQSPEKVVIFSDKALRSIEMKEAEAHLWVYPICGRCKVTFYLPSITNEGQLLLVGSDLEGFKKFVAGSPVELDTTPLIITGYGGKKLYREMVPKDQILELHSVSVSLPFASICARHLIDLFSERYPDIYPTKLATVKNIITKFLPENPHDYMVKELAPSSITPKTVEEVDQKSLARHTGIFFFDYKRTDELATSLISIVDSVMTWDTASKIHNINKKIMEFLTSMDAFYLGLYRTFLISWAAIAAKRNKLIPEALALLEISRDIETAKFDKWAEFFIAHIAYALRLYATIRVIKSDLSNKTDRTRLESVEVTGRNDRGWTLLLDFLDKMGS